MPDRLGEDHFGKETQEGGKQGTGLEKDACYGSLGERGNARRD